MNKLRLMLLVVVSSLIFSVPLLFVFDVYLMCGVDIVGNACDLYKQNTVTGSLCQDLCVTQSLSTTKCMTTSPDKPVYKATWKDKELIIKQSYFTESYAYSFQHLENEEDCKNEIASIVHMLFNDCENCSKLTDKLVEIADVDKNGHLSIVETKTIVQLLRTPEPAMLLVLNGSKVTLNVYGYCGPLYAVESMPIVADTVYGHHWQFSDLAFLPNLLEPVEMKIKDFLIAFGELLSQFDTLERIFQPVLQSFSNFVDYYFIRHRVPSLEERFNFTILHLNTIYRLSNNPYGMIQGCDTHLGNYGLSHDNEYKLIDYDEVYPQHYLQNLLAAKKCQTNKDCKIGDFHECMSSCNLKTNFCTSNLKRFLLQNICPTTFPLVFANLHKDFEEENTANLICVEKAIHYVAEYCLDMPLANNVTELYQQIEQVKEKIVKIPAHCSL